jgi:hypothetical protein
VVRLGQEEQDRNDGVPSAPEFVVRTKLPLPQPVIVRACACVRVWG